jgi:hypothetical protein
MSCEEDNFNLNRRVRFSQVVPIKLLHVTFLLIKLSNKSNYLIVFKKSSPFSPENKV